MADDMAPSVTASPSFTCHQAEGLLTVTVDGTAVVQEAPSSSILAMAVIVVVGGDGNTPVKSIIEDAPITVPDPGAQGPVPNAQMVATAVLPIVNSYSSIVPLTGVPDADTTVVNPASTSYEGLLKVIVQDGGGGGVGVGIGVGIGVGGGGGDVGVGPQLKGHAPKPPEDVVMHQTIPGSCSPQESQQRNSMQQLGSQ